MSDNAESQFIHLPILQYLSSLLSDMTFKDKRHSIGLWAYHLKKVRKRRDGSLVCNSWISFFSHPGASSSLGMILLGWNRSPGFKNIILGMTNAPEYSLPAAWAFISSDLSWCWFQIYPQIRIPMHLMVFLLLRQHLILPVCLESHLSHSLGVGMSDVLSPPWFHQD